MGLMDYLKTQFLEIIQWEDDSRDTISWRFPDEDNAAHGALHRLRAVFRELRCLDRAGFHVAGLVGHQVGVG